MTTLNLQIVAGADDGIAVTDLGYGGGDVLDTNSSFSSMSAAYLDGSFSQTPFFRFTSVTIPQGATINSATLGLTQLLENATNPLNATIKGSNVDNAAQPSTVTNVTGISQTSASASADISAAPTKSYTITSIVQEIVNRGGWSSGNALMLVMFPNTTDFNISDLWFQYDEDPPSSPTLTIDYTAGGVTGDDNFWVSF